MEQIKLKEKEVNRIEKIIRIDNYNPISIFDSSTFSYNGFLGHRFLIERQERETRAKHRVEGREKSAGAII